MADINFPITSLVSPDSATAGKMVYTTGTDINGMVVISENDMTIDQDGNFLTPIIFTSVIDHSLSMAARTVASGVNVTIDLSLGTIINLTLQTNTTITFTGLPDAGYVRHVLMCVKHDATNTVYTLDFAHTVLREGKAATKLTNKANTMDILYFRIDSTGKIKLRTAANDFISSTTNVLPLAMMAIPEENTSVTQTGFASPRIVGVEAGMIVTSMADGTVNCTTLKTDGSNRFTNIVELVDCVADDVQHKVLTVAPVGGVLTLDASGPNLIYLNHDTDITRVDIVHNNVDLADIFLIERIKDNTATPRTITFDPAVYSWEMDPIYTQTALANDEIVIQFVADGKIVTVLNNFG